MTPTEVLSEIQKLPLGDARRVSDELADYLRKEEQTALSAEELERREDEFECYLLAKGVISHIPPRDETDEEFDDFEPIEFEGEPLSEMIIRERRYWRLFIWTAVRWSKDIRLRWIRNSSSS